MILVGYQGIGKSTICFHNRECIDFESSCFFLENEQLELVRPHDWHIIYCKAAINLSKQDYVVCTSSHKDVRDYLRDNCSETVVLVYPSPDLKKQWIDKLRYRYEQDPTDKNLKAWKNAEGCYDVNIKDLMNEPEERFIHVVLQDMNYDLYQSVMDALMHREG